MSKFLDRNLLGAGVLGDGLGAFRDGVLGQLSGEEETDSGLDFSGRDGRALVVVSETAGFGGDSLKDIVDEGVHDAHGLGGDTGVGVDLLQDLVDVDSIGLLAGTLLLLVSLGDVLLGFAGLLGGLSGNLGGHVDGYSTESEIKLMPIDDFRRVFIRASGDRTRVEIRETESTAVE